MFILAICASRKRYFRNNDWTRSKVEEENKACNLGTHESPTRSNISPKKSCLPDSLTQTGDGKPVMGRRARGDKTNQ